MKEIEKYLNDYFGIGGKDLSVVGDLFQRSRLKKNDYFLREDQYAQQMGFLTAGYMRIHAPNADGSKEITQWISMEGSFVTELSSFLFGTPSRFNIQALSDCELLTISKENYQLIGNYVKDWAKFEKLFIAKCFIILENRVFGQLSMTAEQKVRHLLDINPEIFIQVPLQYIASMLGMTPETLSRVRRKMIS